jgi:hypothetical protein
LHHVKKVTHWYAFIHICDVCYGFPHAYQPKDDGIKETTTYPGASSHTHSSNSRRLQLCPNDAKNQPISNATAHRSGKSSSASHSGRIDPRMDDRTARKTMAQLAAETSDDPIYSDDRTSPAPNPLKRTLEDQDDVREEAKLPRRVS